MALPPKSDHAISLDDAVRAIANRRQGAGAARPDAAAAVAGARSTAAAYGFHAAAFERILGQPGCVGIRMYPATHNGNETLILVGIDEQGNDMTGGALAEDSWLCPPFCPPDNSPLTRG